MKSHVGDKLTKGMKFRVLLDGADVTERSCGFDTDVGTVSYYEKGANGEYLFEPIDPPLILPPTPELAPEGLVVRERVKEGTLRGRVELVPLNEATAARLAELNAPIASAAPGMRAVDDTCVHVPGRGFIPDARLAQEEAAAALPPLAGE